MTTIIFANEKTYGTEFPPIRSDMAYQSAYRRTLELRIPTSTITYDEIKGLFTNPEVTSEISVVEYGTQVQENPDGSNETIEVEVVTGQSLHLNYTMPMELTLKTEDGTELWCMKLAQKSALEIAQEKQATDIAACEAAIIDIGELLGGE